MISFIQAKPEADGLYSNQLLQQIEKMFDRKIELMAQKMEQERLQREQQERLNQQNLLRVISETLNTTITKELNLAIQRSIHDPVRLAFKKEFQEVLIPGFDKAIENMFQQLNESFISGLNKRFSELNVTQTQVPKEKLSQIAIKDKPTQILAKSAKVIPKEKPHQTSSKERTTPSQTTPIQTTQNLSKKEVLSDPQFRKIQMLVSEKKFDKSFAVALSARDINILTATCCIIEDLSFLSKLPQQYILCLIQQLSIQLASDTELKLKWLSSTIRHLDLSDEVCREHGAFIIQQAIENLKSHRGVAKEIAHQIAHVFGQRLKEIKK